MRYFNLEIVGHFSQQVQTSLQYVDTGGLRKYGSRLLVAFPGNLRNGFFKVYKAVSVIFCYVSRLILDLVYTIQ